jgi:hypothetical protein
VAQFSGSVLQNGNPLSIIGRAQRAVQIIREYIMEIVEAEGDVHPEVGFLTEYALPFVLIMY